MPIGVLLLCYNVSLHLVLRHIALGELLSGGIGGKTVPASPLSPSGLSNDRTGPSRRHAQPAAGGLAWIAMSYGGVRGKVALCAP